MPAVRGTFADESAGTGGAFKYLSVDFNSPVGQHPSGVATILTRSRVKRLPCGKMACTDQSWGGCQNANHTEPKLIEQVFDAARTAGVAPSGTLTMNIHWRPTGETKAKNVPCANCKKGICG